MEALGATLDAARAWAFPVSGLLLAFYPAAILMWTVIEGRLAADKQTSSAAALVSPESLEESVFKEAAKPKTTDAHVETGRSRGVALPLAIAAAVLLVLAGAGAGFVHLAGRSSGDARCGAGQPEGSAGKPATGPAPFGGSGGPTANAGASVGGSGVTMGVALVAGLTAAGLAVSARARSGLRALASAMASTEVVPRYSPPTPNGVSLWHDVDLHVKSWLDEDTGLYHYVNEMPRGCLQKFEVQPHLPENRVEEDPKGSSRLAAFGRPVPFNYGCFPQTFRDPEHRDELCGAPGDNDPLDVLDLASGVAGVGQVVRCRPLGAVCLIDEGEADWKILAVNVNVREPLADARSIHDVNRLAPGRINECLQWIDDFKRSSGKNEATLDFTIHDMSTALRLIAQDHVCWQKLLQEAGADNMARGQHWVRPPRRSALTQQLKQMPRPKLGWSSSMVPGASLRVTAPWPLVGVSPAMAASRTHATMRQQECSASSPTTSP
mmetsp:Transcript_75833/g.239904  ORF Transcript_75833/g.239904 Transcript_75833/m.239904 type:complete len:494 (-) Transcript_75833:114-1595(-)